MFTKKKSSVNPLAMSQEKFETLIGCHSEIHGTLKLKESVRIDGKVVGTIEAPHDVNLSVVIGPTAEVHGDVVASRIIVAGRVAGNIHAFERVEIMATAVVQGDVKYTSIAVEHGAKLLGLMIQVDGADHPSQPDRVAKEAIRKAKSET